MKTPTHLIINNPYAVPGRYWKHDPDRDAFETAEGRWPAGYMVSTPGGAAHNDSGQFVPDAENGT